MSLGKKVEVIDLQPGEEGSLLDIPTESGPTPIDRQLGYLNDVQEVVVRQQRDIRETLRGTEEPNVYFLYDRFSGEKLYHIQEQGGCCQQQCFGGRRKFKITVFDKFNREVIQLKRPTALCYGDCFLGLGCCSCLDKVTVFVKNYKSLTFEWNQVGHVQQNWNPVFPTFSVCDINGDWKYRLKGPLSTSGCFTNVVFGIEDGNTGEVVGSISKEWSGLCREVTSDADLFSIKFPPGNIDEKLKATLLGGMIFIDFKYFEDNCSLCCCSPLALL